MAKSKAILKLMKNPATIELLRPFYKKRVSQNSKKPKVKNESENEIECF